VSHSRIKFAMLLALVASVLARLAMAADPPGPAEVAAQRRESLDGMLTRDAAYTIADIRWVCAMGREPVSVAEDRQEGAYFTPDAADSCVAALVRTAHDGHLPELYSKLVVKLGGNADGYEQLPRAIGAAVLGGNGRVAIGNGKAAVVTPALAFDAGFAAAYAGNAANKVADVHQLRTLAESCLGQQQDAGACFSAGYAYGARALHMGAAAVL